jgi:protein phosphatase
MNAFRNLVTKWYGEIPSYTPAIRASACTIKGMRRQNNEDCYFVSPDGRVALVADGVGGMTGGERASRMAVDLLSQWLSRSLEEESAALSDSDLESRVKQEFACVNQELLSAAETTLSFGKMGTTVVAACFVGQRVFISSLGDSRAYLVRGGQIERLTVDHSMAQALADAGVISASEVRTNRWRNRLLKFLGSNEADNEPDVRIVNWKPQDWLLLVSDGVTDVLDDKSLRDIVLRGSNPERAANMLVEAALKNGATDDATCVAMFIDHKPAHVRQAEAAPRWIHSPVGACPSA